MAHYTCQRLITKLTIHYRIKEATGMLGHCNHATANSKVGLVINIRIVYLFSKRFFITLKNRRNTDEYTPNCTKQYT